MPSGIVPLSVDNINIANAKNCVTNINFEKPSVDDLLENIKLLTNYITKNQKNIKRKTHLVVDNFYRAGSYFVVRTILSRRTHAQIPSSSPTPFNHPAIKSHMYVLSVIVR